jgi:hypothetical protein
MLCHRFAPMTPPSCPALVIPAPERIHAEGDLGRWIETAAVPCDQHTPEAPNLTGGEPKWVKGRLGTQQARNKP